MEEDTVEVGMNERHEGGGTMTGEQRGTRGATAGRGGAAAARTNEELNGTKQDIIIVDLFMKLFIVWLFS